MNISNVKSLNEKILDCKSGIKTVRRLECNLLKSNEDELSMHLDSLRNLMKSVELPSLRGK